MDDTCDGCRRTVDTPVAVTIDDGKTETPYKLCSNCGKRLKQFISYGLS